MILRGISQLRYQLFKYIDIYILNNLEFILYIYAIKKLSKTDSRLIIWYYFFYTL